MKCKVIQKHLKSRQRDPREKTKQILSSIHAKYGLTKNEWSFLDPNLSLHSHIYIVETVYSWIIESYLSLYIVEDSH